MACHDNWLKLVRIDTDNLMLFVGIRGKLIKTDEDYLYSSKNKEVYFPTNTFFDTVKIEIDEKGDDIEIGPNFFPIANPYEIKFSLNDFHGLDDISF